MKVKLGDVCQSIDTIDSSFQGLIDYIDISSVDNKEKRITGMQTIGYSDAPSRARQLIQKDDILVSTVRPNLNAVALVDFSSNNTMVASTGYCVLRSKPGINPRYIFYYCQSQSFVNDMTKQATGASYPAVNSNIVKSSLITLLSESEQTATILQLDKINSLVYYRKQQLQKLDELVKARFVEMFGEETEHGVPLKECCIDVRGGGTPSMQHPEYYGGNVPFIKSGDVRGDMVSSGALWLTEKALEETIAKYVPQGSVLVVNRSAALLREFRAAIAARPVVINQDIKAFIPKHDYTSEYLLWAIKIQTQLLLTKVTTVLTSHIDLKELLELRIANVSIERQKEFSAFISQVDKSKLSIQASLDQLETLKHSLMQKYFG